MDMSSKPEGATHYVKNSCSPWEKRVGDDWFTFNKNTGEWWCCNHGGGDDRLKSPMAPQPIHGAAVPTTPTLETMLTEWRDLEARAQAAQAEADALFEHAGQCHGEIVVRLAELGWGAPRGKPVVTLDEPDMSDWSNWQVGDLIRVLDNEDHPEDFTVGGTYPVVVNERAGSSCDVQLGDSSKIWLYRESMQWVSRPSTQS